MGKFSIKDYTKEEAYCTFLEQQMEEMSKGFQQHDRSQNAKNEALQSEEAKNESDRLQDVVEKSFNEFCEFVHDYREALDEYRIEHQKAQEEAKANIETTYATLGSNEPD